MSRARDLAAFVSNADGDIKFDTDTLFIDSSANRVGILNTTPSHALDVTQTGATSARVGGTGGSGANDGTIIINNGGTGDAMLRFDYETNTDRARIGTTTSGQQLEFYTAGNNERMKIDSSGNVYINNGVLYLDDDGSHNGIINSPASFRVNIDSDNNGTGETFTVGRNQTSINDSNVLFRVEEDGEVFIGTASSLGGGHHKLHIYTDNSSGDSGILLKHRDATGISSVTAQYFVNNSGGTAGTISMTSSSVAYNTSSDHRLKENVSDISDGITRVKQLQPKRFNWISDETNTAIDGFLAHEAQAVVPEAVTGTHNEVDDDGNPVHQGIDQSKLVPLLTAALQEAITKIETLETENTAIKARLDALEA